MPLHIFEPRYRQMIEDLLDGPGRLVLGTVVPGNESELLGTPPVHPIAGLGEIVRHEKLPDGRFMILVYGLSRVHIDEISSDRMYRQVETERIEEVQAQEGEEQELRDDLSEAIRSRVRMKVNLPDDMPLGQLTDLLLLALKLPEATMMSLFSEVDIATRARGALKEHEQRPIKEGDILSDSFGFEDSDLTSDEDPPDWTPPDFDDSSFS